MANVYIPNITLFSVCWGENYFVSTLKSIVASLKNVTFDDVVIVVNDAEKSISKYRDIIDKFQIQVIQKDIQLQKDVDTDDNRSLFSQVLLKLLNEFCSKDFILTIQPDSCIISPNKWTNKFLEYDYIGAPWPLEIVKAIDMASDSVDVVPNFVGNGGFSLRSKKYVKLSLEIPIKHKNEDLNLCVLNYESMVSNGIKFAPIDVAFDFSVEHPIYNYRVYDRKFLLTYNSFGFHGQFNLAGMKYIHQNSKEI